MTHVQIEVHKGIAEVTKLDPGIEVELVDLDVAAVTVYRKKREGIDWHVLSSEECDAKRRAASHE